MTETKNTGRAPAPRQANGTPVPVKRRKKRRLNVKRVVIAAALPFVIAAVIILLCNSNGKVKKQAELFIRESSGFECSSVKIRSDEKPSKSKMDELFGDSIKVKKVYLVSGKYKEFTGEGNAPASPAAGDYYLAVCICYKKDGTEAFEFRNLGCYKTKDELNGAAAEYSSNIEAALAV